MKENKIKQFLIKCWNCIKRPTFFIPFAITWLLFQTPTIFGVVAYLVTKDEYWLGISGSWIALTAPPLPIPVMPCSIAVGVFFEKLIKRKK